MRNSRPIARPVAVGAAALLGLGLVGITAAPAYAATVNDTAELNAAILADDPVITIGASFTLDADLEVIDHDVQIIGGGYTIDADGRSGFHFLASAEVSSLTVTDSSDYAYLAEVGAGETLTMVGVSAENGVDGVELYLGESATATIAGGAFAQLSGRGIHIEDDWGDASLSVEGSTFTEVYQGISVSELFGDSTLEVSDVTITDAYYGIEVYAYDSASTVVTGATIAAGPTHNSGGNGYGMYPSLYDEASFVFDSGSVTGTTGGDSFYEGIYLYQYDSSSVTISDSTISGNWYNVYVDAYDDDTSVAFLRNVVADGGYAGIYICDLGGSMVIDETTVRDNGLENTEAGIEISSMYYEATLTISRSTVSGNTDGGIEGYFYDGSEITIVNSTISGNDGDEDTAAVDLEGDGSESLFLFNSTVTANSNVTAGLLAEDLIVSIYNSIVSGNDTLDGDEIVLYDEAEAYVNYSLVGGHAEFDGASYMVFDGVIVSDDPKLGPLADNGGPTLTHALLTGSPALNTGDPAVVDAPATDQRGDARILQGRIDLGAVEMAAALAATGANATPFLVLAGVLALLGAALVTARVSLRRSARA